MPLNFPTTGLTAGVTTYTYSDNTWIWNGFAWDSVVTPDSVGLTAYVRTFNGQTGNVGFSDYVSSFGGLTGTVGAGLTSTQVLFWNANAVTGSNNFTFDGTDVVTLADTGHYTGRLLGPVLVPVKNTSGGTLTKGTPVYATGSVGVSGVVEVAGCSASDSSKMPAIGLLDKDLSINGQGHAVVFGVIKQVNTSGYNINGTVFVAPNGGLTGTKPTGENDLIQNIGHVVRVAVSTGEILVSAIGRSNDVPNIVQVRSYLQMPDGTTASSLVKSWNGQTGAVTYSNPLATSSVTGVASFGNEFVVSAMGAVSLTANYVKSVNGSTGAIVSVAVTGSNTFAGLQTMNAGITANNLWVTNGATFASRAAFTAGFTANNVIVNGGATFAGANTVAFTVGLTSPYVYAGEVLSDNINPRTTGGDLYLNTGGSNTTYIGDYASAGNSTYIEVNDNSASISLNGVVQTNDRVSVGGYLEVESGGVLGSGTQLNYTRTALTTTGANQTIWEKSIGAALEIPFTASYRSAELFVQATRGATFESFKMIVGHTNVDTYNTEYAVVRSGPVLGTYTTTLVDVSTDRFLRLRVTPSLTGTTFMVYSTLLPT